MPSGITTLEKERSADGFWVFFNRKGPMDSGWRVRLEHSEEEDEK